ncbi:glycosyltransferase family 2 protein [Chromobacterium sp.]|uniref:glycosyltransferase family 2 protein n=1 Tax=Chromobacterium sp. TaxID=306190 RepID=UPI0035B139F9
MSDAFVPPYLLGLRAQERPADPLVCCIVPAYNESANIVPMLQTLHQLLADAGYRHELIVVDDGSRDDTVEQVLSHSAELPVTLIQLSRNFGKEIALTAGIDHVRGDIAVLIDSDFQHPPEMVPVFLEEWRKGYDMVYSVRSSREDEPLAKRLFTRVFYQLANSGSRHKMPADTQDFRVLDRCVVEALRQMPERNRFMKGMYHWVGFTQRPMPTQTRERRAGQSSFNYRRLLDLGITGLTAFSNMPLRIWTVVGCLISLCAIGYAGWELVHTLLFGNPVSGWPTLAVAISFLGGVQLLSIGILGEYVGRIFDEVKQRPTYLISRISGRQGASGAKDAE